VNGRIVAEWLPLDETERLLVPVPDDVKVTVRASLLPGDPELVYVKVPLMLPGLGVGVQVRSPVAVPSSVRVGVAKYVGVWLCVRVKTAVDTVWVGVTVSRLEAVTEREGVTDLVGLTEGLGVFVLIVSVRVSRGNGVPDVVWVQDQVSVAVQVCVGRDCVDRVKTLQVEVKVCELVAVAVRV